MAFFGISHSAQFCKCQNTQIVLEQVTVWMLIILVLLVLLLCRKEIDMDFKIIQGRFQEKHFFFLYL
jgi:hypothetical protein